MRKVVIASAHPFACLGMQQCFAESGLSVIVAAPSNAAVMELTAQQSPDALVLDISLPQFDGLTVLEDLRDRGVISPVLLIAAELHDLQLLAALKAGVDGLVEFGAGPQAVLDALALVLRGGQAIAPELQTRALHATRSSDLLRDLAALSPRGRMLLEAVVAGRTTAEIAAQLGCGIGGARVALHRLYTQLGVRSRTALTRLIGENKVRL